MGINIMIDEKYYMVCDTTKSDAMEQPIMTEEEIAYSRKVIDWRCTEIDRLLDKIELYRQMNFYEHHAIERSVDK